jgi:gluconolactonase
MTSKRILTITLGALGAAGAVSLAQIPSPAGKTTGPGVQAAADSKEPELLKGCKTPPPARGGGRGPGGPGRASAEPPADKSYEVKEIPGVIAAGQKWKEVWKVDGNNADGIIATKDGGILIAQNNNSDIVKLDKDGKTSVVYSGLNTSGAVSMNTKGVLFVNNRGLKSDIVQLEPTRKVFANTVNGDVFDCVGTVLNDLTAASNGGVYFTMGGLFYANPKGEVTRYGGDLHTNGVILSPNEKTLYVTNGPTVVAFDVQPDGSLTNQRDFAKLEAGGAGDGSTVDSQGRLYVTSAPGIQVFSPEGKYLGLIPTPQDVISAAFSGPDKKTLYAVLSLRSSKGMSARIISIPMLAQGYKGRAK